MTTIQHKKKVLNDPIYGFIPIQNDLIASLIEHPYFQRLRRINQLGVLDLVYPGARHTRFHHAIGAMHLMKEALNTLRDKGHEISTEEYEATLIAILLHDIGHGPFSHTLEKHILQGVHHESLSLAFMHKLNIEFNGSLTLAIEIFTNNYSRLFFNQLISSQLDIDRLDYLQRDSFFTGVHEGIIGAERIIKMLNVVNEQLVVEEKGIYNVENFLNARRLMYWQVYLHKTAVSAEQMLKSIFKRAKHLALAGHTIEATPSLKLFIEQKISINPIEISDDYLHYFAQIDDYDIWGAIKYWQYSEDRILACLSKDFLNRNLFKIQLSNQKIDILQIKELKHQLVEKFGISQEETKYFIRKGKLMNAAYVTKTKHINILNSKGEIKDIAQASDLPNIKAISKIVQKYYLSWAKNLSL